ATVVLVATWLLTLRSGGRLPPRLAAVLAAGAALGASHWVRNTALVFLVPSCLLLALHREWPPRWRSLALGALGAGFLVPVLALLYLDYLTVGVPSPVASQICCRTGGGRAPRGGGPRGGPRQVRRGGGGPPHRGDGAAPANGGRAPRRRQGPGGKRNGLAAHPGTAGHLPVDDAAPQDLPAVDAG